MNTEHGQEDVRTFSKSANSDKEKEFLGAQNTGEYISSRNARNYSLDGNTESLEKIQGEELIYPNSNLSPNYICLGAARVLDNVVEFWASPLANEEDSIRVNGTVVAQTNDLQFNINNHLQLDTNDNCKGGEVFITDNFTVPMIFNVGDLLSSVGTQKYFSEFNRAIHEINLSTPVDKPVFTKLVTVGGGGGLPVGQYSYAIRYVSEAGDRTNLSPTTPLIPVTQTNGSDSAIYPGTKTRGSNANLSAVTSFGIELKFRVTNIFNYDSIEIIRYAWNAGTQLGFLPEPKIIGRVDVSGNKLGVITFVDPAQSNIEESLPVDEITNQLFFIEKAKAIRYFDKRLVLMNYSVANRDFTPTFIQRSGVEMFPIMDKMGKLGHKDPYNHAYKKSYASGEKYGFAINAYDGVSSKAFAIDVPNFTNYQFPNRRDEMAAGSDSEKYSTGGVLAANTDGNVTKTFEAFDIDDATSKSELRTFKNILDGRGFVGLPDGTKSTGDVNQDTSADPELFGANVTLGRVVAPYAVYTPIGDNDPDVSGHNYRVNTFVDTGNLKKSYNPQMFGLNYHAKGIALNGIDKSTIPDWVKSFTVVRTKRANRVVCQGLGMYSMIEGDPNAIGNSAVTSKERNKFWFYSPDLEEGVVGESLIEDMRNNPNNYKLQFVSPLGFASELYNFDQSSVSGRDRACDLMTYARVIKDGITTGKQINENLTTIIGNGGYTAYNKYRNSDAVNGDFFGTTEGGNRLAQMTGFEIITEGRGSYFEITTQELVYNRSNVGGTGSNDFDDQGLKDWTEPFYIVNIIQEGANVVPQDINDYVDTGAYIKMESIIGEGNSSASNLSFELVDERWEDCIPDLSPSGPLAAEERYVWLRDASGIDRAWYNVTYVAPATVTTIINNIISNGFHTLPSGTQVYGVYTHSISGRNININFNVAGSNIIPTDTIVLVKYNSDAPIKIFGGDTTVGETMFSPVDRSVNVENLGAFDPALKAYSNLLTKNQNGFNLNIGFPFRKYFITPRHFVLRDTKDLTNKIQASRSFGNRVYGSLYYIRQLCVMFTVESRIATHFAYNANYPNEFFPNTHYVMRPNTYSKSEFPNGATAVYEDNNIYPQYEDDYGDEYLVWDYGGIRFKQNYNIDYSQENIEDFVSKPQFGFTEETDFCTGVIWSLPRAVNQQDSPGLRSFASLNSVQLEDAQGEINLAYDATTSKGSNIYAITDRGICLLLHKKSILSDVTGTEVGLFKGNNFIQQEYWLDRNIGIPGELWRAAAEGSIGIKSTGASGKEEGEVVRIEGLTFLNNNSIYRFINNSIKDIGRDAYFREINGIVKGIPVGQAEVLSAFYDERYNEYLFQTKYQDPNSVTQNLLESAPVYSFNNSGWISKFDYRFDKYLSKDNLVYGMRDGQTYILGRGYVINGQPVVFEAETVSSVAPQKEKEFIKIEVNSNKKPTRVEFKNGSDQIICALDQSIQGPLYLKKYNGYAQMIPRKDLTVSPGRERVQDRLLVYKIIHNLGEDFVLKDVVTTFKPIK